MNAICEELMTESIEEFDEIDDPIFGESVWYVVDDYIESYVEAYMSDIFNSNSETTVYDAINDLMNDGSSKDDSISSRSNTIHSEKPNDYDPYDVDTSYDITLKPSDFDNEFWCRTISQPVPNDFSSCEGNEDIRTNEYYDHLFGDAQD